MGYNLIHNGHIHGLERIINKEPMIIQRSYGVEQANTYYVFSNGRVLLVDICSVDVVEHLISMSLVPEYLILTHEHVDHLWGLNYVRSVFPNITVIAQKLCSNAIGDPKLNKSILYHIYAALRFGSKYDNPEATNRNYYCDPADIVFEKRYFFEWSGLSIHLIHTPGHSPGSCIIIINDNFIFSGDTMMNGDTFLQFDDSSSQLFHSITDPILNDLPDHGLVFPGHGFSFIKADWHKK